MKIFTSSSRWILLIATTILNSSCQTSYRLPEPGTSLLGQPQDGLETIAVVGTNDIHGTLAPLKLKTRESDPALQIAYTSGGAAMFASYLKQLRSEFGPRLIWLDAGDEFQGSVESNHTYGAPMVALFNRLSLTAAAIGNHEFDFGQAVLKKRMSEAKYPYLAANVFDKESKELAQFPNTLPSYLVTAGRIPVGIIGLSTLDTPKTTHPGNVSDLSFEDLKDATLRESRKLRKKGAKIILITAHAGLKCGPGSLTTGHVMRKPTDIQGECDSDDEIVRLIRSVPSGTVDAVVSGHTHQVVHHWIAGVPVIQAGAMGQYLNVVYLTYDWKLNRLISEDTRIEGPIPVCEKVFKFQNDCNGKRLPPKRGRGPLQPPRFHGKTLQPDADIAALIKPVLKNSREVEEKKLGTAKSPIEHTRMTESEMGNLVADAIRSAVNTDFSLINCGGIRNSLEAGPITYGSVFRVFPFDNKIATLTLTPEELGLILRVAQNGSRGFPSVSGLVLKLLHPSLKAPFDDLNGNGKFESWKVNRLLDVRLPNGSILDPEKFYTLATLDFLAVGGDDLAWATSQIPSSRIRLDTGILAREALASYISDLGLIDSPADPLVKVDRPRLVFEKSKQLLRKIGNRLKKKASP